MYTYMCLSSSRMLIRAALVLMLSVVFAGAFDLHGFRKLATRKNLTCALVFGDSTVDPGNNNGLNTTIKSNFLPYGKDFINKRPTGRFTDGKLSTDFVATAIGINEIIPAFLDPNLKKGNLIKGVSFASAGSGYDDLTANFEKVLSVPMQLQYFKHYKIQLKGLVGGKRSKEIVKNALFALSMGTNDFMLNYFVIQTRSNQFTVEQYVNYLTTRMAQYIKEMHRLGATRLVVIGVPPIGCLPFSKALMGTTGCVDKYNQAAILMNSKIKNTLTKLKTSLGMTIGYQDIYNLFEKVRRNPTKYGFMETTKGCCGTGMVEFGESCRGQPICKETSKYMFWDAAHPTEAMYKIISEDVLRLIMATF